MAPDHQSLYDAYASRDPRFDGIFFVGVTSTGIYCRPVCTARTPKRANCRFFDNAESAEKASFRPCLRCRPELAPGNAPVDDAHRIAALVAQRIDEGMLDDGAGLELVASKFGWSSRQIRRIVQRELGVSPIELVLTRRLLLAKQLLTETALPITQVAFASGFSSLRRFNDAFKRRYGMPPTRLRRAAASGAASSAGVVLPGDTFTLQLSYRDPFDWQALLAFLGARALEGVETVTDNNYSRTVRIGDHVGWVQVTNEAGKRVLHAEITHSLMPVLPALLGRLRNLFDLGARPDIIAAALMTEPKLAGLVSRNPGLRVPGCFDGFELALRAILGQQISVKAATTVAARTVRAFGERLATTIPGLTHLSPTATRIASAPVNAVTALGVTGARAQSICTIAREIAEGRIALEAGSEPYATMKRLVALPGIGSWTAHYIAMRALRWTDAFPSEDMILRRQLGEISARRAEELSQAWRPWRSYATLHLWNSSNSSTVSRKG
ncbi:MAG: helix-turn-helix domain-containing protein [Gemmatimonadota bacterium]|nr:helix-turn-helix domain-containing protein [Gemmatimonadota bacterium]